MNEGNNKRPRISCMTLSNRYGGVDIMWANLLRQEFADWEWIFVDGLYDYRAKEVAEYTNNDSRVKHIKQSSIREGAYTNLAHADNEGFKACSGDLIVCLQDYQWILPSGFTKYWLIYEKDPKALVTGFGHHYSDPRPVDPKGKITVFDKPFTSRPSNLSWSDPRPGSELRRAEPVEWEMSWCSLPRQVIYDIGGMDEQFDYEGFAWDNTYIAYKAKLNGSNIYLDPTNEVMGFDHDLWWPNPLKENRISPAKYFHEKVQKMMDGNIPAKDEYLSNNA